VRAVHTGQVTAEGPTEQHGPDARQGNLDDLVTCLNAPSLVLSASDGQIGRRGVEGWMCADRRYLSTLSVTVDGSGPVGLRSDSPAAGVVTFRGMLPGSDESTASPAVLVDRRREQGHHELVETVTMRHESVGPRTLTLEVEAAVDFNAMAGVRTGRQPRRARPEVRVDGLRWSRDGDAVTLRCTPAADTVDVEQGVLTWARTPGPGEPFVVALRFHAEPRTRPLFDGVDVPPWEPLEVACPDPRLDRLVGHGLADLEGLLLADPADAEEDVFAAAGSPWFLTLFGRDSLWTARMLLPLGTDLAMSTLRVLARRQGRRRDPTTEEQPGGILHEVRPEPLALGRLKLPTTYYGTVDATPLFVTCCAEALQWGAEPAEVEALLPAVEACLRWLEERAQEDGFVRYVDATGHGLGNQGWKDAEDAIQWADGTLAEPPIALSEAQAYAYQAAVLGSDLLTRFDRPGAGHWQGWAADLANRFRAAFWVEDGAGPYPAIALDAHGRPVDSVASNMGHLLGTGLLSPGERELVAARIGGPELSSGFGLRTLTSRAAGYSPLSYHCGAVWPHDTAIAVTGLARDGFGAEAARLFQGLVRAASAFDFRLPELYAGDDGRDVEAPRPYPTACRPQAWAAAAPVAGLAALLGLRVDAADGTLTAAPVLPRSWLPLRVDGLRIGRRRWALVVDEDGGWSTESDG